MAGAATVRTLLERSLRKIGAFSIRDTAADPEEMEEAGYWLDFVVKHLTTVERSYWLVPAVIDVPLTANKAQYTENELRALAPTSWPENGLQFPFHATIFDGERDADLRIVRRLEFDDLPQKDRGGKPTLVHVDRQNDFIVRFYPVPDVPTESNTTQYRLRMTGQAFQPTLSLESNSPIAVNKRTELREGWELWAVIATAAQIGNGPVRKLPADEVRQMHQEASDLRTDLKRNARQEHDDESNRVRYVDY